MRLLQKPCELSTDLIIAVIVSLQWRNYLKIVVLGIIFFPFLNPNKSYFPKSGFPVVSNMLCGTATIRQ